MSSYAIAERMLGKYPVSISTSLALESATNIHDELKHAKSPLPEFQELWINLRTLYRNLMGAMPKESQNLVAAEDVMRGLMQEVEQLQVIAPEQSMGRCKCVFYVSNHKEMERHYPHASIRRDTTDKQKLFTALLDQSVQLLLNRMSKAGGYDLRLFQLKLDHQKPTKALMLTHIPLDLTAYYSFSDLVLLESHTGAIKSRSLFYTKYLDGNQLPMIPFREELLQIFGDKELFHPYNIKVRQEIIEIAKKNNWSQITTKDRIKANLEQMKDLYNREIVKQILK